MPQPDYPDQPKPEHGKQCCQNCDGIVHTIRFMLPQHQEDLDVHMRAWKYRSALEDFHNWIRNIQKHGSQDTVTIDELAEKYSQIITENEAWLF